MSDRQVSMMYVDKSNIAKAAGFQATYQFISILYWCKLDKVQNSLQVQCPTVDVHLNVFIILHRLSVSLIKT